MISLSTGRLARSCWLALLCAAALFARAADTPPPPPAEPITTGTTLETLAVGKLTYTRVTVRSVGPRSAMIVHDGGMASVLLRDLAPDLQARFGYDPARDAAASQSLAAAQQAALQSQARAAREQTALRNAADNPNNAFDSLFQKFGQPAEVREKIDLRSDFILPVKSQGRRPSCSVFAVVCALEYQNACLAGRMEKLSEEYLIWATRQTLRSTTPAPASVPDTDTEGSGQPEDNVKSDAGYGLLEVVSALRAYGIPLLEALPNNADQKIEAIAEPTPEVIAAARDRRRVYVHVIMGRDEPTRLANIVHTLNARIPVVIGLRWPHSRTVRNGFLAEQKPVLNYAHAVTLVGYRSASGRLDDCIFKFKNSYGHEWGMGGYGEATYAYLSRHLLSAIALEVQPGK